MLIVLKILKAIKRYLIRNDTFVALDGQLRFGLNKILQIYNLYFKSPREIPYDSFTFILHGGIGDAVLALPAITRVSLCIHTNLILIGDTTAVRFLVDKQITVYEIKREDLFNVKKMRALRVNLNKSILAYTSPIAEIHIIRLMLGIKKAIGYMYDTRTINSYNYHNITQKIELISRQLLFERLADVIIKTNSSVDIYFPVDYGEEVKSDIRPLLSSYVVFAVSKTKSWEMGKLDTSVYAELAKQIIEQYNFKIILVGSEIERQSLEEIIDVVGDSRVENYAGRTTIAELKALLKYSKVNICNDNGIAHISGYINSNTITLFTFSDPEVYKWQSSRYKYLFNKLYPCMPCVGAKNVPQDNYPVRCKFALRCRNSISVSMILNQMNKMMFSESS